MRNSILWRRYLVVGCVAGSIFDVVSLKKCCTSWPELHQKPVIIRLTNDVLEEDIDTEYMWTCLPVA